ncbi:hypothetical protein VNI00_006847 [Paramarasmius palmivorus]|uniref:F-box domain-containing protein n=1 Tax=Paramarasmius palmivorus TaxID=297713 RepID=A0AAW0D499_9AGAR
MSTPLTISHVCTRWRKVAISTGSLWTKLAIFLEVEAPQLIQISTWLRRSKNHPLEILLDMRYEEWDWDEDSHPFTGEMMKVILGLLLPHIGRWKTFELLTNTWEPIYTFLVHTSGVKEAPMLQSVALSRCNAYFVTKGETFEPEELKNPVPLFGGSALASLRDVSLAGVHFDWAQSSLRNLLDLSFKFHAADVMPSLKEFKAILDACPELQSLTVLGWGPCLDSQEKLSEKTLATLRNTIMLARLTRLSFGFVDVEYATRFLSMFHLPSLRELELQDISASLDPMGPLDATSILDMLLLHSTRDAPEEPLSFYPLYQIECLELEGLRCSEERFSRFLRALISLKKIGLSDVDKALLTALSPTAKGGMPSLPGTVVIGARQRRRSSFASTSLMASCPQLENMVCRRVDYRSLSEVVLARCQTDSGVRRLQKVEIDLQDSGDEQELVEEGSSFTLTEEDKEIMVKSGVDLLVQL